MRRSFLIAAAGAWLAGPAAAQDQTQTGAQAGAQNAEQARYQACIARTETEPVEAYEDALAWASHGGGEEARHCTAIALIRLGHVEEAATRLERLAGEPWAEAAGLTGEMFRQAAAAWLLGGELARAENAAGEAIEAGPADPGAHVVRARVRMEMQEWEGAERDLDTALESAPASSTLLVLRAQTRMAQGALAAARQDAEAAVEADPDNIDARLALGDIREAIRANGGG